VFNFKALKHKGSQRISRRAQRKKSIPLDFWDSSRIL
jgi:hypothetical protein